MQTTAIFILSLSPHTSGKPLHSAHPLPVMQRQASAMYLFNSTQNLTEYPRMICSYCSLDEFF